MKQQKNSPAKLLLSGSIIKDMPVPEKAVPGSSLEIRPAQKTIAYIIAGLLLAIPVTWYFISAHPATYFRYPLNLSPELAANFGEVRSNHFHMGLDLRTKGRENFPVYAVADGYISRVQVEEDGFGKAVFINHPNGTTSVYAHLSRFSDDLEQCVHQQQYEQEQWQQDIPLPANRFRIKKGELIAYSGNTGASEGPHLHFELRNSLTGKSINPLLGSFTLSDDVPPVIKSIYWYNRGAGIYETNAQPVFSQRNKPMMVNAPVISLGIEAFDKDAATRFKLGIYKAALYMDSMLMHAFSMEELSAADTRYVNGCIDYAQWINSGKSIQYLFTLPGNRTPAFSRYPANGILDLHDRRIHQIRIVVSDVAGNTSTAEFPIQFTGILPATGKVMATTVRLSQGQDTTIKSHNAIVHFGANALYDAAPLLLTEEKLYIAHAASVRLRLLPETIPVYDNIQIALNTTLSPRDTLRKHTVMQLTNKSGKFIVQGTWTGNSLSGNFDQLGTVQLIVDTIPPVITLVNPVNQTFSIDDNTIRVLCKDNPGDVASFRGELDGHWIVFARKGNEFTYLPDNYCKAGSHNLTITATDKANNTSVKTFYFVR